MSRRGYGLTKKKREKQACIRTIADDRERGREIERDLRDSQRRGQSFRVPTKRDTQEKETQHFWEEDKDRS
jgi:hypothetical protein